MHAAAVHTAELWMAIGIAVCILRYLIVAHSYARWCFWRLTVSVLEHLEPLAFDS